MSVIHIEKLKDGREIHFHKLASYIGSAKPRFCTFCGSENLSDGDLTQYDLMCKNCGMHIHDCCTQTGHIEYVAFIRERKKRRK